MNTSRKPFDIQKVPALAPRPVSDPLPRIEYPPSTGVRKTRQSRLVPLSLRRMAILASFRVYRLSKTGQDMRIPPDILQGGGGGPEWKGACRWWGRIANPEDPKYIKDKEMRDKWVAFVEEKEKQIKELLREEGTSASGVPPAPAANHMRSFKEQSSVSNHGTQGSERPSDTDQSTALLMQRHAVSPETFFEHDNRQTWSLLEHFFTHLVAEQCRRMLVTVYNMNYHLEKVLDGALFHLLAWPEHPHSLAGVPGEYNAFDQLVFPVPNYRGVTWKDERLPYEGEEQKQRKTSHFALIFNNASLEGVLVNGVLPAFILEVGPTEGAHCHSSSLVKIDSSQEATKEANAGQLSIGRVLKNGITGWRRYKARCR